MGTPKSGDERVEDQYLGRTFDSGAWALESLKPMQAHKQLVRLILGWEAYVVAVDDRFP